MSGLLDLPAIRERMLRLSVDEYHRWTEGQPTELLHGIVIKKMSKSPLHYATIEALREILSGQIKPGWVLRQEGPLTFADSEPEPDLAIVRGRRSDYRQAHPVSAELVIEVAVSSFEIDLVKGHVYAEAAIPEYWIVCPEEKRVEVFRLPQGPDGYAEHIIVSAPDFLKSSVLPNIQVDLATLFV
ncbi:MAG TPA: Uma2 family endonuclease [Chthoniobacter sp.]|jgi:Uma2 family endonuclease